MSTPGNVLKGIREAIVVDQHVWALSQRVDRMDAQLADKRERLIVLETMLPLLRRHGARPRLPERCCRHELHIRPGTAAHLGCG